MPVKEVVQNANVDLELPTNYGGTTEVKCLIDVPA